MEGLWAWRDARAEMRPLKPPPLGIISLLTRQTQLALSFQILSVDSRSPTLVLKNFSAPRPLSFCLVRAPFDKYCMRELFIPMKDPLHKAR